VPFPGRAAARSGATQTRGPGHTHGPRISGAPLRAAPHPGNAADLTRAGVIRHWDPDQTVLTDMAETVLNLRGLRCPLPALKTRKALKSLAAGDRLVVECTDPLSKIDIPNLLRETGDVLEADAEETGVFVFRIRKSE